MAETAWQRRQPDNWLRLLKSGDPQTFAEFIDNHKETVFLCCRRLGLGEHEAEDVAGETFLAAHRGLRRYDGRSELSTWLYSIAYRQAISFLRKNRRARGRSPARAAVLSGSEGPKPEQSPTAIVESRETEKIVWEAVDRLPKLWAMAVILFYREQKSVADIAKIMNTKQNTVKTYLFRGRERLKTALSPALAENRE